MDNEVNKAKMRSNLPEGFQVKASLYLWPSISISSRIGTKLSAVGLPVHSIFGIYII